MRLCIYAGSSESRRSECAISSIFSRTVLYAILNAIFQGNTLLPVIRANQSV